MNLVDGAPLLVVGTILFALGVSILRPERDAPKDWRYWTGTVIGTIGAGIGMLGAMYIAERR